jgi:glycosyltransferase involved in cell wall biosynthesis
MRITHVSTHDITGGAARAAFRLHEGLRAIGVKSTMFVGHKASTSPHVLQAQPGGHLAKLRAKLRFNRIQRDIAPYRSTRPKGFEDFHDDRACDVAFVRQLPPADIVHLHFVSGFVDERSFLAGLPRDIPVVWTAHDMAPLTGGCHYDAGCDRYTSQCGRCPQLGSSWENDLSRRVWNRRRKSLSFVRDRLQFVVASRWMEQQVKRSALCSHFPVECIPFGLDCDVFRPIDKAACRTALGIDPVARVVLFVSDNVTNRRKGLAILLDSLSRITHRETVTVISVGRNPPPATPGVNMLHLGGIANDQLLAIAYNAADVFVAPSLQEAFGQTVVEAMACGVPVVGFATGGISDLIQDETTGYLCPVGDAGALAHELDRALGDDRQRLAMGQEARTIAVRQYPLPLQAERYLAVYERLLRERGE